MDQLDNSTIQDTTAQKILLLAPEWGFITKVGGLADVVESLSQALLEKGLEVRTILIGYRHIRMKLRNKYFSPQLPFFLLEECIHPDYPGHIFYLIKHPALDTIHEPYSPSYSNNGSSLDLLQAIFLALAPFAIRENPSISWKPDIVHCNDWLCGLFPYFNQFFSSLFPKLPYHKLPSLFTIHNASYTGTFSDNTANNFYNLLRRWGIATPNNLEIDYWKFSGEINLLATGLRYAEKINTVSPTYARELLEKNIGISSILQKRHQDFCGILNGVDNQNWAPATDPFLKKHRYRAIKSEVRKAKLYWKKHLEEQLQFPINTKIPLLISICRIVKQKGLDQLFGLNSENKEQHGSGPFVEALEQDHCQLILLGEGDQQLELQLQMLSWQYSRNFMFLNYFHEEMAHILTAAADFFIMPSLYEPCGLNQIYSLRYGTTPIVKQTGGLADTIKHKINGLVYQNPDELGAVLNEALYLWHRKPRQLWSMREFGMGQDFSWQNNLDQYIQLYNGCIANSERQIPLFPTQTGHEPL